MRHDSTEERTRRGYAIMLAMVAAAVLIFNVDRIRDWLRGYMEVTALVTNTRGVRVGSRVVIEGVEAGRVMAIEPAPPGAEAPIALRLRIDDRVRPALGQGTLARTARRRFIGEPVVRLSAAPPSAPPVADGDTIPPAETVSVAELLRRGRAFPGALDSLRSALQEVRDLTTTAQPRVAAVAERLAEVTDEAAAIRRSLDGGSLAGLADDPELIRRLGRLAGHSEDLAAAVAARDSTLPRAEMARLAERARRLEARLAELQEQMDGGTLDRFQRDSALARAIAGVRAQIDSLTADGFGFALRMLR